MLLTQYANVPIDVVVGWVNKEDRKWRDEYNKTVGDLPDDKRYRTHGELELCISSICKYLPWVRTIYVVTECEVTPYIKQNRKVKLISQRELFDTNVAQPNYNSNVIQAYWHKIPGLSEIFICGDDDCFVGKPMKKEDWLKNNKPLSRFYPAKVTGVLSPHEAAALRANVLAKTGGTTLSGITEIVRQSHTLNIISKSAFKKCGLCFLASLLCLRKHGSAPITRARHSTVKFMFFFWLC